jgi:uncharacterized cupredoxin-like copper-binding protein
MGAGTGRARRGLIGLALAALLLAACGGDDGEGVRDVGGTGPASGSGGGSASGTGSGSAPATTTKGGGAAAACKPVGGSGGRAVTVDLKEFSVAPRPASSGSGKVTFKARNQGTVAHELVVARAASPSALPTGANGAVDTARLTGQDLLGEVEPFGPGQDCTLTVDLTPGSYAVFCNIVTDGDAPVSHYQRGMVNVFTVS